MQKADSLETTTKDQEPNRWIYVYVARSKQRRSTQKHETHRAQRNRRKKIQDISTVFEPTNKPASPPSPYHFPNDSREIERNTSQEKSVTRQAAG